MEAPSVKRSAGFLFGRRHDCCMAQPMLTLAELESTLQIEYELQLEALDEQALRELLAEPTALRRLAPPHLSDDEVRRIADATLAAVIARKAPAAAAPAPAELPAAWARLFTWFWTPLR
jgi:hypothetical protein